MNSVQRLHHLFPLAFCLAFVAYSAVFVLGQYQTDNGDFDQYAIHARNLILMRPWSFIVAGFPGVLPGYPTVLAAIFWLFGLNLHVVGVVNAIAWAAYAYAFFLIYRTKFDFKSTSYIYILVLLTSYSVISFQQEGLPNIVFAASCALALLMSERMQKVGLRPLGVLIFLLPTAIRLECVALYAAVAAYSFYARQIKLAALAVLGIIIALGLDYFVSNYSGMVSNVEIARYFATTSGGASGGIGEIISSFAYMIVRYIFGAEIWLLPPTIRSSELFSIQFTPRLNSIITTTSLIFVSLVVFGASRRPIWRVDKLYLCAHLIAISCLILPEAPQRYSLPIIGVTVFYAARAIEIIISRLVVIGRYRALCVVAIIGSSVLVPNIMLLYAASGAPRSSNYHFSSNTLDVADMLSEEYCSAPVAYYKTRIIMLLMDVRHCTPSVLNLRSPKDADAALSRDASLVVRKGYSQYGQIQVEEYLSGHSGVKIIWEDKVHIVYRRAQ